MPGSGTCRRCTQPGHWQDDPACPWLTIAPTHRDHFARLDAFKARFLEFEITVRQKTALIEHEIRLEKTREKRTA